GDLDRDLDHLVLLQAVFQPLAQSLALNELHRHKVHDAGLGLDLPDLVYGQNVRMAGGAGGAGLLLKAPDALRVLSELRRQQFESDATPKVQVLREIDLTHPARAELGKDSIMRDCLRSHARPPVPTLNHMF